MSTTLSSPTLDLSRPDTGNTPHGSLAPFLDGIVHKHMATVDSYILNPLHREECLLGDIGAMLVRIMAVVSRLSEDLVKADHVEEYTKMELGRMRATHDFADFDESDYLLITEERLENMLNMVRHTASTVQQEWARAPARPVRAPSEVSSSPLPSAPSSPGIEYQPHPVMSTPSSIPQGPVPDMAPAVYHVDHSQALGPETSNHVERRRRLSPDTGAVQFPDLDDFKTRGKGSYYCPMGYACKKGGVIDGRIVLFERNCNFRSHIQKHERPYKCLLPGCSNKPGFARIDQLKRHQQSVVHST